MAERPSSPSPSLEAAAGPSSPSSSSSSQILARAIKAPRSRRAALRAAAPFQPAVDESASTSHNPFGPSSNERNAIDATSLALLKEQIDILQRGLAQRERDTGRLQVQVDEQSDSIKRCLTQIAKLEKQGEVKQNLIEQLRQQRNEAASDALAARQSLVEAQNDARTVRQSLNALNVQANDHKQERESMRFNLSGKDAEIKEKRAEIQQANSTIASLNERLQQATANAQQATASMQSAISAEDYDTVREDLQGANNRVRALETEEKRLTKKVSLDAGYIEELEQEMLQDKRNVAQALGRDPATVHRESTIYSEVRDFTLALTAERDEALAAAAEHDGRASSLSAELQAARDRIGTLEETVSSIRADLTATQAAHAHCLPEEEVDEIVREQVEAASSLLIRAHEESLGELEGRAVAAEEERDALQRFDPEGPSLASELGDAASTFSSEVPEVEMVSRGMRTVLEEKVSACPPSRQPMGITPAKTVWAVAPAAPAPPMQSVGVQASWELPVRTVVEERVVERIVEKPIVVPAAPAPPMRSVGVQASPVRPMRTVERVVRRIVEKSVDVTVSRRSAQHPLLFMIALFIIAMLSLGVAGLWLEARAMAAANGCRYSLAFGLVPRNMVHGISGLYRTIDWAAHWRVFVLRLVVAGFSGVVMAMAKVSVHWP